MAKIRGVNHLDCHPGDIKTQIYPCGNAGDNITEQVHKRIVEWAYECTYQPKGLHINEAFFLVELMDMYTMEPIEELNVPGKIVITAFDQYAQPCIRFDTKDISMWGKTCECGRIFCIDICAKLAWQ